MGVTVIDRNSQIKKTTGFAWVTNASDGTMQDTSVTASRAVASDGSGLPVASSTTSTELAGLHALTANSIVATNGSGILTTLSDPLPVAHGGTGDSTLTAHAVLLGEGTSSVAFASPGTTAYPLVSNGASSDPSFQQLSLTAGVTGTLPIANGGTNSNASLTNGFLMVSSGGAIVTANGSDFSMDNGKITNLKDPTVAQDAATKNYVDGLVNGLSWKNAVEAATAAVLPKYAYSNGSSGVGATLTSTDGAFPALVVDGYTPVLNDRILVKNETSGTFTITDNSSAPSYVVTSAAALNVGTKVHQTTGPKNSTISAINYGTNTITLSGGDAATFANGSTDYDNKEFNGIYTVTSTDNSNTTEWVLTRSLDQNTPAEFPASAVIAEEGTVNASTGWVCTTQPTVTVGTTDITFVAFGTVNTYLAGNGLDLTGFTFSISTDDSLTAFAGGSTPSLVVKEDPAGTITTGASGIKVNVSASGAVVITSNSLAVNPDNSTIDISSNQLEVKTGGITNTQVSSTANIAVSKLALTTGDIIVGVASVGAAQTWTTFSGNHFVIREVPSGSINSSNVTFTLASTPITGTEEVFLNGLLQQSGASFDYTISGGTITYNNAPQTGDILLVNYQK